MAEFPMLSTYISILRGGLLSALGMFNILLRNLEEKQISHQYIYQAEVWRNKLGELLVETRNHYGEQMSTQIQDDDKDFYERIKREFGMTSSEFCAEITKILTSAKLVDDAEINNLLHQIRSLTSDVCNLAD